jgi:hypothetical protein
MNKSHKHQSARGSLDFHRVVPNKVPKVVGLMCQAHSAFNVFDNSDQELTQFIDIRVSTVSGGTR